MKLFLTFRCVCFILCVCVCLGACMCHVCTSGACRGQWNFTPWNWNYRWLWTRLPQGRNLEEELMLSQGGAASWLPPPGWPSLLSYRTHDHPQRRSMHNGLGPPTSVTNQENALQACPQQDIVEAFSQLKLLSLR